ncbi:MAG: HD domain-containing protein [Spirochaetales bacterium]|nr:HD domain-containing protein [Spirochaetales bacterium]
MEKLSKQFEFLKEIEKLKTVIRRTFILDESRCENDAEHSWQVAVMALIFSEYADTQQLDMLKVLKILLFHDAVEVYAGDTYLYDAVAAETQSQREIEAAGKLFGLLPDSQQREFRELWEEYEEGKTAEAKYARAIDRFQPFWHNYMTRGKAWQKHGVHASQVRKMMEKIEAGSGFLFSHAESLLADAVKKGYLPE